MASPKVLLIGGTSHVGKSTLGRRLAEALSWNYLSTDQLARHPGRPWRADGDRLPADCEEHYSKLPTAELVDSVLSHYRANVWPIIEAIIRSRLNNPFDLGLVLEGSALLPEMVAAVEQDRVRSVWLTAPTELITDRIRKESNYAARSPLQQKLIDAFLLRTLAIDELLVSATSDKAQALLDASRDEAFDSLLTLARPDP